MKVALLVVLLGATSVLYVLAIYPVLLAIIARLRAKPIQKDGGLELPVSIVLPVRNGERWIESKLDSLLSSDYPSHLIHVLVLSDGSQDRTDELVENYSDQRVRLLRLPAGGKARAVNRGIEEARGGIIVFTDVRQPFDRLALRKLVACFADPSVGVVTGELVIREGASSEEYNTGLYWRYEKWIRRNLNRIDAMLGATGAIYAIRRELVRPMPVDTLLDDVHLPFAAASQGSRIYFECDAKAYDLPTSLHSEFRRKVRTQAGVYQIMARFPALLWLGNRRFIHFLSHKVGRLLLPFGFLAIAAATPFLEGNPRLVLLLAQALFYGAALIDPFVSEGFALKKITAIIRAFLVLVAAAFCAVSVFVLPAQSLWKDTRATSGASRT